MEESATKNDVHIIQYKDKEIAIIGTAHISKESVDTVREFIEEWKPDHVALELDDKRYNSLKNKDNWENLNLLQVIKKKQLATLFFSLVLSNYQKKLSQQTGVAPGSEMVEADAMAEKNNIPISFADRDARITLKRAWRLTPFFKKSMLLANLFGGLFDKTEVDEESLSEMRQSDTLTEMLKELGKSLPTVKKVLIDERDEYLAEKIRTAGGKRIVAVVGAGHVEGIKKTIQEDKEVNVDDLNTIPPGGYAGKAIAWGIPLAIIGSLIYIGIQKGGGEMGSNILYWILVNGGFAAVGTIIALGHPLTILTAFAAAPLTSLNPMIGVGFCTTLVQVLVRSPSIKEIKTFGEDFNHIGRWWKNGALKILLVMILSSIGSMIGTFLGGAEIIKNMFG